MTSTLLISYLYILLYSRSGISRTMETPGRNDCSESFYSVYSHDSVFKNITDHPQNECNPTGSLVKETARKSPMAKIAKSSIQLDDVIQIDNLEKGRQSFETVLPIKNEEISNSKQENMRAHVRKGLRNEIQAAIKQDHNECMEEVHNISQIESKPEPIEQSMCLLKQIDCLSVQQISPQQLQEVKKKIEQLKRDQFNLQGSLTMATQLLKNAKSRNTILEQQVAHYRSIEEERVSKKLIERKYPKLLQTHPAGMAKEHRFFPQQSTQRGNASLNALKILYKECSANDCYCIYQNDGYKIEVSYQRQKYANDHRVLVVCLKLTPHHHIISRKQFKFGLEVKDEANGEFPIERMSYDGGLIAQEFASWPNQKFHINVIIYQFDELNNHRHSHPLLVPLPLPHFLEPRMASLSEQQCKKIKATTSQYSLALSGQISTDSLEKLKGMWWIDRVVSCLGWNELIYVQIKSNQEPGNETEANRNGIGVEVFGKKNGQVVTGVIQFLSFYLVN